tara:strand:- start:1523 stop:2533 length:1011 start_codon:yes stop_codon:yes gene_type:complete
MFIFSWFTKLLHYLPSEFAHSLALNGLKLIYLTGMLKFIFKSETNMEKDAESIDLFHVDNKLGIAAGLDKNGDYIDCLAALGISFIEIGTVTPRPQGGNPKPRVFRNTETKSIINRLGFNNKGINYVVDRLKKKKSSIFVGTSIGKNFDTSNDKAYLDYIFCMEKVYEFSDYIAVNISSPNTLDLRDLSKDEYLNILLTKIKYKQEELSEKYGYKPIFLKVSPDEDLNNLKAICEAVLQIKLDGLICTNTSIDHKDPNGKGGLSGAPLRIKSTEVLEFIKNIVNDKVKLIASGGVMSIADFQEKLDAGADLVQIYTGFIYEGPKLIQDINHYTQRK